MVGGLYNTTPVQPSSSLCVLIWPFGPLALQIASIVGFLGDDDCITTVRASNNGEWVPPVDALPLSSVAPYPVQSRALHHPTAVLAFTGIRHDTSYCLHALLQQR